jgi:hypothetical protein
MANPTEHRSLYEEHTSGTAEHVAFTDAELRAATWNPAAAIDIILAQHERWTANIVEHHEPRRMVSLLLMWAAVFALPYGMVLSLPQVAHVAMLFLGSVALCLPSLHVVSAYLGLRVHIAQSTAFAAVVATVASVFSFAFAPILWFLQATTDSAASQTTIATLSGLLLSLAALAGAAHGMRSLRFVGRMDDRVTFGLVVFLWQLLLLFIGVRMSTTLGLS